MDWLVVGLGNPGKEYDLTPHNMGFMVCDSLSFLFNFDFVYQGKFKGFIGFFASKNGKVGVLKPQTYMNLSGYSVVLALNYYKVPLDRLIVVHDDIDLPLGRIKIKRNSSSGGHKGVESIIQSLGSKNFIRVKLGVGRDGNPSEYVLSRFGEEELRVVEGVLKKATDAVITIIEDGLDKAMSLYNKRSLGVMESEGV